MLGERVEEMWKLLQILRGEGGCPWDRKQKLSDYLKYLCEERDELAEALEKNDREGMVEEAGDVFWNALTIIFVLEEKMGINAEEVLRAHAEKIIRRHPHVFGDEKAETPEEVLKIWEREKRKEKGQG